MLMPKAAMYEEREALATKYDVGPAGQIACMAAIP
jgi:hypothetical protein